MGEEDVIVRAMDSNRDKVLLVTGGSRGIGAAIARGAGRSGWRVVVNYAKAADAAEAVVREIDRPRIHHGGTEFTEEKESP